MKKIILIFLAYFQLNMLIGQSPKIDTIAVLNNKIQRLEKNVDTIYRDYRSSRFEADRIDKLNNLLSTSYDSLSAQFSVASIVLGIFGLLGIGIAGYVTYLYKKANDLKTEVGIIKEDLNQVRSDLFKDADVLLSKLKETPDLIDNIIHFLSVRELNEKHYKLFEESYLNLKSKYANNNTNPKFTQKRLAYLVLGLQKFPKQMLFSDFFREIYDSNTLKEVMNYTYLDEIIETSKQFYTESARVGLNNCLDKVTVYTKNIFESDYKQNETLIKTILSSLGNRNDAILVENILNQQNIDAVVRQNFSSIKNNIFT